MSRHALYHTELLISKVTALGVIGHDLNGGGERFFAIDHAKFDPQGEMAAGGFASITHDPDFTVGSLLSIAPEAQAFGRCMVLTLRNFEITTVFHTEAHGGDLFANRYRHIMISGETVDGASFVLPSISPRARFGWDFTALETAMTELQIRQYQETQPKTFITHDITRREVQSFYGIGSMIQDQLNEIFNPRGDNHDFHDATSFSFIKRSVTHNGPGTRAELIIPANVDNDLAPLPTHPDAKRGAVLMLPYFRIDGKNTFIQSRTLG